MSTLVRPNPLRPTALALALLAAFGPAMAQDSTATATGSVTVGGAAISGDSAERAQFGQYNGLRTEGRTLGLLEFEYARRNEAAGTQIDFQGSNLLGETRELGLRWRRQGDWKFGASYGETVRYEPYAVRTGLLGAGTTTPEVVVLPPGDSGTERELKVKRTALGLSLWKSLAADLNLEVKLKSEDKKGSRLFGSGITCPSTVTPGCRGATGVNTGWALLMLPEPIDANHSQVEARLSYASGKLRLNGGYYGSFYNNSHAALSPSVPGSLNNGLGELLPLNTGLQALLSLPLALPPDNQAHQFDIAGTYALPAATQLRFKLARARAEQSQAFASSGWTDAPAGVSDLGGRVDTTLALLGLSSRPLPKLALQADLRYEDKNDRTPIADYNVEGSSTYTNARQPLTRTRGKLQASYQFSTEYRGLVGLDHERIDRGVFTATSAVAGVTALRQKTDETVVRAELRRLMSESFSAVVGVEHSERDGSNWLKPNSGTGVTEVEDPADPALGFGTTGIFMPSLADRKRDKVKLRADWQPSEDLAVQVLVEDGRDRYDVPSLYGLRRSANRLASVDLDYALTAEWRMNGYLSYGTQDLHQSRPAGYILSFANTNTNLGLGVTGKPLEVLEVGGTLSYVDDKNVYKQTLDASLTPPDSVALLAATGGLPNVTFRQASLRLFGKYAIDKRSSARVDLVHQRSRLADWSWSYAGVPFAYADGTTVWQQPKQSVTLLSVTYRYSWE